MPQNFVSPGATGVAVGDQSDAMLTCDLLLGQVEDMAEKATDRGGKTCRMLKGGITSTN